MTEALSERLNLSVSKTLLRAIDDWRRVQPDIPARAEAARRLIEQGLDAHRVVDARRAAQPTVKRRSSRAA
jgi:hypothetical protein